MIYVKQSGENTQNMSHNRAAAPLKVNMADRSMEAVYNELVTILTVDYACLALNLPNGSKTVWSILEQDMKEQSWKEPFVDEVGMLKFLSMFFAKGFVQSVSNNLQALAQSSLGIEFTLRRPKADFGKAVIEGLREDAFERGSAVGTFLGMTSELQEHKDADEELYGHHHNRETPAPHQFGRQAKRGGRSAGRDEGEAITARGAGLEGKEEGDGKDDPAANPRLVKVMDEAITRWVQLPAYKTPPRNKPGRNMELKDRSKEFTKFIGHKSGLLYNPLHSVRGIVSLYHGTRSSSLESFAYYGINPEYTASEFSRREAFYLTNSIQYAYEFPLHYHPSRSVADPIAILEFKVKAEILHGEQPPSPESSCFRVKWFRGPDEVWKKFCLVNMLPRDAAMRLGLDVKHHSYDIVIGPICKNVRLSGEVGVVGIDLPNNVYLTQVALCTMRAIAWLEENLRVVYRELRRAEI